MDLSIKTSILLMLSFLGLTAHGETFHGFVNCPPQELTLHIKNQSRDWQRAWTQVRQQSQIDEIQWSVGPGKTLDIQGSEFMDLEKSFGVKTVDTTTLRLTTSCKGEGEVFLTSTVSPEVSHFFPLGTRVLQVSLTNLYIRKQSLSLRAFNKNKELIAERQEVLENSYDTLQLKWTLPSDVHALEIQGSNRLSSQVLYYKNELPQQSPGLSLKPTVLVADPDKIYFLVSTKNASDESFVIALDNQQTIETAREQIRNPALEKIVVAGIELSSGNNNRNFLSRDKAPYSWHVSRVDAFADFAHIDCDGSPDLIEERLEQKLSEGGRICFWRYRVVRELTLGEVSSGKLRP